MTSNSVGRHSRVIISSSVMAVILRIVMLSNSDRPCITKYRSIMHHWTREPEREEEGEHTYNLQTSANNKLAIKIPLKK